MSGRTLKSDDSRFLYALFLWKRAVLFCASVFWFVIVFVEVGWCQDVSTGVESIASAEVAGGSKTPDFLSVNPAGWVLGNVESGTFRQVFNVTNNTSKKVTVQVKFSCGSCFRLLSEPGAVEPGGAIPVEVEINTKSIFGKFKRTCVFMADDDAIVPVIVPITGIVDIPALVPQDRMAVDLGVVEYGDTVTRTISVKREGGQSLKGYRASTDDDRIKTELIVDKDYEPIGDVRVTYSPESYPESIFTTCRVESDKDVILEMILVSKSKGAVEFKPREIVVGRIDRKTEVEESVTIDSGGAEGATVELLSSRVPLGLRVELSREAEGLWTARLRGKCEEVKSGSIRGEIRLGMNVSGCGNVSIPILGSFSADSSQVGEDAQ